MLARAIEPFFSTKGIGKGTGLGLSMVHGLANQLGGALRVQSEVGLGTNIELVLPVAQELPAEGSKPSDAQQTVASAATALLVDDEDLVRESTAAMLSDLGFKVIEAPNGDAALRILDQRQLDLLITDHLMPGISGSELARRARAKREDLPVLLVSGYAESDGDDAGLPRLVKPFRQDELVSSLKDIGII